MGWREWRPPPLPGNCMPPSWEAGHRPLPQLTWTAPQRGRVPALGGAEGRAGDWWPSGDCSHVCRCDGAGTAALPQADGQAGRLHSAAARGRAGSGRPSQRVEGDTAMTCGEGSSAHLALPPTVPSEIPRPSVCGSGPSGLGEGASRGPRRGGEARCAAPAQPRPAVVSETSLLLLRG